MNKKKLSVLLSRIAGFSKQDVKLEQYPTDPDIAAEVLWTAYLNGDIRGKIIADLGCGHGILGLGALILGAKKAYFVDIDQDIIGIAKKNKKFLEKELGKKFNSLFFNRDIKNFSRKADVVLQNPPFGVKNTHVDKLFLLKAMEISRIIYTFHKLSTEKFVRRIAEDNGFRPVQKFEFKFPLKKSLWFHVKRVYYVNVGCWKLSKAK